MPTKKLEDSRSLASPCNLESSSEPMSPKVSKDSEKSALSTSPTNPHSASEPNPTEGSEDAVPSNPSKKPLSSDDPEDPEPCTPESPSEPSSEEEEEEEEPLELAFTRTPHVILAVCGSVEAVNFDSIYDSLAKFADVRTVATESAYLFIEKSAGFDKTHVYTDKHDWSQWERIGDPVLHVSLVKWADIMVIAPLSANTLVKIATGLCDNLVTCIVRAWDYRKPLYLAPAMDVNMWNSPITRHHVKMMHNLGASFITPYGTCMCKGEFGDGSMVDPSDIGVFVNFSMIERKRNCGCHWIQFS